MALTIKIDANAALRSASFGLGQIMGFNHKVAGYASPGDMVATFCDDEAACLEAVIRFIGSEGLDDELRRHDWSAFARGYNRAGYAKHGYHTRLAAAFKRWQAVPDVLAPSYPKVRLGSRGAPVRVAQERLLALGCDPRGVDGIFGAGTRAAAIAFQFSAGLSQDGILGPRPGWPHPRACIVIKTIAPIFILKTRSFWLGIFPLLLTALDTFFTSLSADGDGGPLVQMLAQLPDYDPSEIRGFLLAVTPLWGLIIAQQRGGFGGAIPRSYTMDPEKEKQIMEAVENGKATFEAGMEAGEALQGPAAIALPYSKHSAPRLKPGGRPFRVSGAIQCVPYSGGASSFLVSSILEAIRLCTEKDNCPDGDIWGEVS